MDKELAVSHLRSFCKKIDGWRADGWKEIIAPIKESRQLFNSHVGNDKKKFLLKWSLPRSSRNPLTSSQLYDFKAKRIAQLSNNQISDVRLPHVLFLLSSLYFFTFGSSALLKSEVGRRKSFPFHMIRWETIYGKGGRWWNYWLKWSIWISHSSQKNISTWGKDLPEKGEDASSLSGVCSSSWHCLGPDGQEELEQEKLNTPPPNMALRCTWHPLPTATRHSF